jgi:hypothetical protein
MESAGMFISRAQWPHTISDIVNSLDGVWGLVGATGINGNLYRLERSLKEPLVYTLTEYQGENENIVLNKSTYTGQQKDAAVNQMARALGFQIN